VSRVEFIRQYPIELESSGGTFDDPNWFILDRHIWIQSKLS